MIKNWIENIKDKDIRESLIFGLSAGLLWGLTAGLLAGLVNHTYLFNNEWYIILVAFIIVLEVLFLLDKEKRPKRNKTFLGIKRWTIFKKLEAGLEALIIFSVANLVLIVKEEAYNLGYFGVILIGIWILFKLNEVAKR